MFVGKVTRESLGSMVGNEDGKSDGRTLGPRVGSNVGVSDGPVCATNGKYDGVSDGSDCVDSDVLALVVFPKGRLDLDKTGSSVGPILEPSVGRYDGD
jgi:hypothetical protein